MPNWCFNTLSIDTTTEGGKVLAEAFRPKYKYEDSDNLYARPFQDLMPCPEELRVDAHCGDLSEQQKANKEKYGYTDWYGWCWDNWGVKWDARVEDIDDTNPDEEVHVYFDTPWNAPTKFFEYFAKKYPDARFEDEYTEEGMQFEGKVGQSDIGFFDECWDLEPQEDEFPHEFKTDGSFTVEKQHYLQDHSLSDLVG